MEGYQLTDEERREKKRVDGENERADTIFEIGIGSFPETETAKGVRSLVSRVIDGISRALGADEYGA